jgi:hypothetical protein
MLYEPDENMIASYVGYGITSADIYQLHPNMDEYRRSILADETVYSEYPYIPDGEFISDLRIPFPDSLNIVFEFDTNSEIDTVEECIICCNSQSDTKFNCNHEYCGNCTYTLFDHIRKNNKNIQASPACPACPLCRKNITNVLSKNKNIIERMNTELCPTV